MDRVSYRFHVNIWDLYILPTRVRGCFSGATTSNEWKNVVEREVIFLPTMRAHEPPTRCMDEVRHVRVLFVVQRLLRAQLSRENLVALASSLWSVLLPLLGDTREFSIHRGHESSDEVFIECTRRDCKNSTRVDSLKELVRRRRGGLLLRVCLSS